MLRADSTAVQARSRYARADVSGSGSVGAASLNPAHTFSSGGAAASVLGHALAPRSDRALPVQGALEGPRRPHNRGDRAARGRTDAAPAPGPPRASRRRAIRLARAMDRHALDRAWDPLRELRPAGRRKCGRVAACGRSARLAPAARRAGLSRSTGWTPPHPRSRYRDVPAPGPNPATGPRSVPGTGWSEDHLPTALHTSADAVLVRGPRSAAESGGSHVPASGTRREPAAPTQPSRRSRCYPAPQQRFGRHGRSVASGRTRWHTT